jgi:hypothetical protein
MVVLLFAPNRPAYCIEIDKRAPTARPAIQKRAGVYYSKLRSQISFQHSAVSLLDSSFLKLTADR